MYRQKAAANNEEREELDRWLVSYADYMTLMFALFVVLYALSLLKNEEFTILTDSLTKVFERQKTQSVGVSGLAELTTTSAQSDHRLMGSSVEQAAGPTLLADASQLTEAVPYFLGSSLQSLEQELTQSLAQLLEQGLAQLRREPDWLVIELNSGLLFASGSATATQSARVVLAEISKIINPINNFLRIRGYTDNIPIANELFASNWELSVARATSVLRVLESTGTLPQRMVIEGYGEYAPSADNRTAAGRAANRKVEIAISRYGYMPVSTMRLPEPPVVAEANNPVLAEDGSIRVISLPGGGIRITTRADNPDALPQQQEP